MNTLTAAAHAPEGRRTFRFASVVLGYGIAPILCVLIVAFLAWTEPRFFSRLNLLNVSRNFSLLGLAATGQALVMIAGGFDMSVGAAMALASIVQVSAMVWFGAHFPAQPAVMVCVAGIVAAALAGGLLGLTNALVLTRLKVVPFMATLAVTYVVVGGLLYYTKGVPLYGVPDGFTDFVGRGTLLSVPVITWIGLIVIGLVSVMLTYSRLGRHVYAVGGHAPAARIGCRGRADTGCLLRAVGAVRGARGRAVDGGRGSAPANRRSAAIRPSSRLRRPCSVACRCAAGRAASGASPPRHCF
ncbi:Ribose ABC transport system, permease protein RbsC [Candidatus Burkholderia verschuerenii]|uniref:Ribose ABC transport system, permease protein RbsC n=1 Tax=Candidatus Burkholderia verschuerenii TaxID=242163 RepID=A0A0L0M847_9BURK|nr:ABC transporter permease [Candidatus Burkholderia verschuerenii]KND58446.1 Ribose ABC transport system, permease protein RbsC [Candidatus Burkholderia verschuerenii]